MVLELHVWGPAFGLPSIDAACIAAIGYFNAIVPRSQWTLVADYDPSISPQGDFPLLVHADDRVTGFANIVSYLRNLADPHDLDDHLTPKERTESIAFSSFLESTASPLLDLYLYVSSENYNCTTSAAYTAILPWHTNYTLPPRRRHLARARTAHLGLSSLDVTEASQDNGGPGRGTATSEYEAAKRAAGIPTDDRSKALNMGRAKGVGGLLSSPIYAARFKLDRLSNELLQPLADRLAGKDYILDGVRPSSLDCVAFGYLALLLSAPVPQAWVKEAIQTQFPRINKYIQKLRRDLLGNGEIRPADVWSVAEAQTTASDLDMQLPWVSRSPRGLLPQLSRAVHASILPSTLQRSAAVQDGRTGRPESVASSLPSPFSVSALAMMTSALATGLTALAIYHRRSPREGPIVFWALRPQQPVLDGFGVESFLSALPR